MAHLVAFPPDGFFSGDQGPKYLQAAAFARNGPLEPDIAVLSRDIDPGLEFQDPILHENRGRLIAAFNWLLPMVTAPFLAIFGLRGLYVIPALSTIVIFIAARHLGRALGLGDGRWSAWAAVAATPVLFYAGELWEHAPAAAGVIAAAALLVPDDDDRSRTWRPIAAGASLAIAALFREEAFAALPALLGGLLFCRGLKPSFHLHASVGRIALVVFGAALVFAASLPINAVLHGSPWPLHLTAEIGKSNSYWIVRREALEEMVLPRPGAVPFAVVTIAIAIAAVMGRRARPGVRVALAHAGVIGLLLSMAIVPLSRLVVSGPPPLEGFSMSNAAHTWVFGLALVYVAFLPASRIRVEVLRYLAIAGTLLFVITLAVVPSFGGAQWSPRYLLCAAPLLAVLAPAPVWMSHRIPNARRVRVAAIGLIGLSVFVQLEGLWALMSTKRINARVTATTRERTTPDDVLVTTVPWFPEVTATLLPSRRMLFVRTPEQIMEIARRASTRGFKQLAFVTHPEVPYVVPNEVTPPGAPCRYVRAGEPEPLGRSIELHRFVCR